MFLDPVFILSVCLNVAYPYFGCSCFYFYLSFCPIVHSISYFWMLLFLFCLSKCSISLFWMFLFYLSLCTAYPSSRRCSFFVACQTPFIESGILWLYQVYGAMNIILSWNRSYHLIFCTNNHRRLSLSV